MSTFLERMGRKEPRSVVQVDSLDEETRTALWNIFHAARIHFHNSRNAKVDSEWMRLIWIQLFKKPLDEFPGPDRVWPQVKQLIREDGSFEVLDFIEESAKRLKSAYGGYSVKFVDEFVSALNAQFEQFLVGYRFVDGIIVQIDSPVEVEAIVDAIDESASVPGARKALQQALELLADRQAPDYATSITRSISAVEAVVKKITGKGVLSEGLKEIRDKGLPVHKALIKGWTSIYGWTSDEEGLRHGGIEPANVDQAMAKYMLVTCSAFVSYLLSTAIAEGVIEGD